MTNNTAWQDKIEHVVVLMMENRSFDMMLGGFKKIDSDCNGVDPDHPASNSYIDDDGNTVTLQQQPETSEFFALPLKPPPFDPLHDFVDVQAQLGGDLSNPNTSGFLQDAYNNYNDKPLDPPLATLLQRIMNYFPFGDTNTPDTLPGLQGLARMFRVCDKWFCSLPGPTLPNRFFAMLGSCYGKVRMPASLNFRDSWLGLKIFYTIKPKNSIFSVLKEKGVSHDVYSDATIPIALMSSGVYLYSWMDKFFDDAKAGQLPSFSWLEPNYSYSSGEKGNSQHPPEDVRKGDRLIEAKGSSLDIIGSPCCCGTNRGQTTVFENPLASALRNCKKSWPATCLCALIPSLPLVAHRNDDCRLAVDAVQRDIAATAKRNRPFSVFGLHLFDRSSDFRMWHKDFDALTNSFNSFSCGQTIFDG